MRAVSRSSTKRLGNRPGERTYDLENDRGVRHKLTREEALKVQAYIYAVSAPEKPKLRPTIGALKGFLRGLWNQKDA